MRTQHPACIELRRWDDTLHQLHCSTDKENESWEKELDTASEASTNILEKLLDSKTKSFPVCHVDKNDTKKKKLLIYKTNTSGKLVLLHLPRVR